MGQREVLTVHEFSLEKFSKALYGTTELYLQCTSFPSCNEGNREYKLGIQIVKRRINSEV